jgi:hypothetical protein
MLAAKPEQTCKKCGKELTASEISICSKCKESIESLVKGIPQGHLDALQKFSIEPHHQRAQNMAVEAHKFHSQHEERINRAKSVFEKQAEKVARAQEAHLKHLSPLHNEWIKQVQDLGKMSGDAGKLAEQLNKTLAIDQLKNASLAFSAADKLANQLAQLRVPPLIDKISSAKQLAELNSHSAFMRNLSSAILDTKRFLPKVESDPSYRDVALLPRPVNNRNETKDSVLELHKKVEKIEERIEDHVKSGYQVAREEEKLADVAFEATLNNLSVEDSILKKCAKNRLVVFASGSIFTWLFERLLNQIFG